MLSYINPNHIRNYVTYPRQGPLTAQVSQEARSSWVGTNTDADHPAGAKLYPFILTAAGKTAPKPAVEKLFTKHKDDAGRTRLDCPGAAMTVHLDSLLAAKNADKLMEALAADSDNYVALDHPYGPFRMVNGRVAGTFSGLVSQVADAGQNVDIHAYGIPRAMGGPMALIDLNGRQQVDVASVTRNTTLEDGDVRIEASPLVDSTVRVNSLGRLVPIGAHFTDVTLPDYHAVNDPRPGKSLYEQVFVQAYNLQVGDHIYVANHAFHRSRLGFTIWNGEHSFVLDPWRDGTDDPFRGLSQMMVTGHGVTRLTVAEVVWKMLEEINTFLEVARHIVDAWLAIPANRAPIISLTADDQLRRFLGGLLLQKDPAPFTGSMRAFNLDGFTYQKHKKSGKTDAKKKATFAGYWLLELEGTWDAGTPNESAIDRKSVAIFDYQPDRKDALLFGMPAKNEILIQLAKPLDVPGRPRRKQFAVSYLDDLAGLLFYMPLYYPDGSREGQPVRLTYSDIQSTIGLSSGDRDLFVIRPRVRADADYLDHLKTLGALE
jgi:hypothetical protein